MTRSILPAVRNRLLSGLAREDFALLGARLEPVELTFQQALIEPEQPIRHVYFPETGIASYLALLGAGHSLEVGMIGRDGMVGGAVLLGASAVPHRCQVQVPGQGWRIGVADLRDALGQRPSLNAALLRYLMAFLNQVVQISACNGAHRLDRRLARWLLMAHDRLDSDRLPLTHELLSTMLGVRRAGVTLAARGLQGAGIIDYKSGDIAIRDRAALEAAACECYPLVRVDSRLPTKAAGAS